MPCCAAWYRTKAQTSVQIMGSGQTSCTLKAAIHAQLQIHHTEPRLSAYLR